MCETSHEKLTVCEGQGCLKEKGVGEKGWAGGVLVGNSAEGRLKSIQRSCDSLALFNKVDFDR